MRFGLRLGGRGLGVLAIGFLRLAPGGSRAPNRRRRRRRSSGQRRRRDQIGGGYVRRCQLALTPDIVTSQQSEHEDGARQRRNSQQNYEKAPASDLKMHG